MKNNMTNDQAVLIFSRLFKTTRDSASVLLDMMGRKYFVSLLRSKLNAPIRPFYYKHSAVNKRRNHLGNSLIWD